MNEEQNQPAQGLEEKAQATSEKRQAVNKELE